MENKFCGNHGRFKIAIIEDSEIHQEWLYTELMDHPNFAVIHVSNLAWDGIDAVKKYKPDLVILDFQLHDMTGLEVAKRVKNYHSDIKIFMLTAHNETSIIERIINHKDIDAIAIKGSPYFEINFLTALVHVLEGGTYLDPSLLKKLRKTNNINGLNKLTTREFEIFIQSNSGKSDDKIADDLCVELSHIRNVKSRIASKIKDDNVNNIILKLASNSHLNFLHQKIDESFN